jgi:hypothetical protein
MVQESVGWDLKDLDMFHKPSASFKIYMLFLLVVGVVTIIKLIRVWRAAPPFRLSSQAENPSYLKLLRISHRSLCHWAWCPFLGWAILSSASIYNVCYGMLNEMVTGRPVILYVILDLFTSLSMALWVALFVFLVRWHVCNRIERLRY